MERELRKNKALWSLFDAIVQLRDRDECAKFLRDLCTMAELQAMAERWEVARMLAAQVPYRQIADQTGCSTATITRIAHWLHHGEGGYRMMLSRLDPEKGRAAFGPLRDE
jgi:TrpR-related protein YerC/YecD